MGVPVVTLAGDRHSSRVGASLLNAICRPEWVARSWTDYVEKAAALAGKCRGPDAGRRCLRLAMSRSPLLDHEGQAARFGAALQGMWREWCARSAVAA
jgi:predicted O-linked N-acetylglucosamine transferase (SPINDLY family)